MTQQANVVSEGDIEWSEHSHGKKFGYKRKSLSSATGARSSAAASTRCRPGAGRGHAIITSQTRRLSTSWRVRARPGSAGRRS